MIEGVKTEINSNYNEVKMQEKASLKILLYSSVKVALNRYSLRIEERNVVS
jgi:hypothetical protein